MKKAYFISDLHLGATYLPEAKEKERLVADFLLSLRGKADSLYLMGDILDYWFEYKTVVPRGYVRFFGALAALVDEGVKIKWFIGNHDIWLFDYLRDEIGIEIIDGCRVEEIKGKRFFLTHGDGVGQLKRSFRFIRAMFRNKVCQKLYSGIHPRWTVPFALRWSSHSRMSDKEQKTFEADNENLVLFAKSYLCQHPDIDFFVFGHRHELVDMKLSENCRMIILGDWLTHFSYGEFDGENFSLQTYEKGKNRGKHSENLQNSII